LHSQNAINWASILQVENLEVQQSIWTKLAVRLEVIQLMLSFLSLRLTNLDGMRLALQSKQLQGYLSI